MPPVPRKDTTHDDAIVGPGAERETVASSSSSKSLGPTSPPNPVAFINIPLFELTKACLVMGLATYAFYQVGLFESFYWLAIYAVCQLVEEFSPATMNLSQYLYPIALVS